MLASTAYLEIVESKLFVTKANRGEDAGAGSPVTVNEVAPVTFSNAADMVVLPAARPLASPAGLIVATAGAEELHVTEAVRFCVVRSERVPVAKNCCVDSRAMEGMSGVTVMETNVGAPTVSVVEPVIEPTVAVTVEVPAAIAVARPLFALIVAVATVDEFHVAVVTG